VAALPSIEAVRAPDDVAEEERAPSLTEAIPPLPESKPALDAAELSTADIDALEAAGTSLPIDPASQAKLTRLIQRELRRVGCLKAKADGVWGTATQRAMQRFADRIEADLPLDEPDGVLLMLVEKFDDRACGAPCPSGEVPNARGRCEPVEELAAVAPESKITVTALVETSADGSLDAATALEAAPLATALPTKRAAAKPRTVKTRISRVQTGKRSRVSRLVASSKKTRWSLPRYGLGVVNATPTKTAAKPRKKRRVGGAAAYRRWMKRNDFSMR
jgi:peptidoglycan hydrolase-like protein with peptidoglycan-binding domain